MSVAVPDQGTNHAFTGTVSAMYATWAPNAVQLANLQSNLLSQERKISKENRLAIFRVRL